MWPLPALPQLHPNRPLHLLSTFGIGGPARWYAEATSVAEVIALLRYCQEEGLPFFILGKGSNSLFDDRGFDGLVIANKIDFLDQQASLFRVGAGYSFARLGQLSAKRGYAGLEFASGIPASVGGAIFMNAGANGQACFDCLEEVHFLTTEGELLIVRKQELTWGYRHSSFQQMKGVILEATFVLKPSEAAKVRQRQLVDYRLLTQPLSEKSCGCIFQNPEGFSAGRLIEECGLKGASIQGALVSELHANFIVNRGGATQADVRALIARIKEEVYKKKGIWLQEEVRLVPYDGL